MQIKKGDIVQIMAGKDAGKKGKVLAVNKVADRILVEGVNLYKKHKRPKRQGEKGEIITMPRYLSAANTMLICNSCDKPVRVGFKMEGDIKVRYCKKCQAAI